MSYFSVYGVFGRTVRAERMPPPLSTYSISFTISFPLSFLGQEEQKDAIGTSQHEAPEEVSNKHLQTYFTAS